jgi:hypothetical protein
MRCIYGNRMTIFLNLLNLIGYDVWKMFEQLGSDQIYEDAAVCTARGSRMKGLGTELCRRTDLFAKEQGCTHTYAFISGKILIQNLYALNGQNYSCVGKVRGDKNPWLDKHTWHCKYIDE